MIVEELIYKLLQESPDVTTMVGDRIYPNFAPKRARRPFIVFYQVSYWENQDNMELGVVSAEHGFQFELHPHKDISSENYLAGKNLAQYVRQAFRGNNHAGDGLCITSIRSVDQKDDWLRDLESHAVKSAYIFTEQTTGA